MKRDIYKFVVLFLLLSVIPFDDSFADSNLSVDYIYKGKEHHVKGRALSEIEYVFNEGGTKKIELVTLDWAPYIGRNICKQGWVQQFTVAMLASQGYKIKCSFYPWARAVLMAESGQADILYPEYYIEPNAPSDIFKKTKRRDHLALSERIPGGAIAFMKRKNFEVNYGGDLHNLKHMRIGVVRGYQNTPEFDRLMDQQYFKISQSVDDVMNVRKLAQKRTDLIIGDSSVIIYSVFNHPTMSQSEKNKIMTSITTVLPVIQYNHLYYALSKKRPGWRDLLDTMNQTIAEMEGSGELFRIISETNNHCGFEMGTLYPYKIQ